MSERSERATRCVTVAMIQPCTSESKRLATYRPIRKKPMRAMAAMSMPVAMPSVIRSVISESRPGPASVSTVPSAAHTSATIITVQYFRQ